MAQPVKNPPVMQETQIRSLGWEKSLGGGHGNPLQYSCLENPMDRGAWWATVHVTTKIQTQLKQFSMHMCICSKPTTRADFFFFNSWKLQISVTEINTKPSIIFFLEKNRQPSGDYIKHFTL